MKKLYILLSLILSITASAQYNFTVYDSSNSGIVTSSINDIKVDANGLLWISTYFGVSTFDGTTFTNYTTINSGIASNAIKKIEIDGLGRKWMASQFNGIILRNGTTWTNYTTANSGLPNNAINDIAVDGLNNLWIATASGLTKFNGTTWTTYTSLPNLNSIATDNSNGVWVVNNFGVLYKFNGTDFNTIYQGGTNKILKIVNNTIYCDSGDGLMTITTGGAYIGTQYQSTSCLSGYQFNALDVDSNNKVWIGFGGTGLQNFNDCTSYTVANSDLPDNSITAVRTQASGTIWVGTLESGLVKMTPGAISVPMTPAPNPTLPQSQVISMFSNVYSNVPVDTWLTSWSLANLENIQIAGNDTKKYSNLQYAAAETVANPINISNMTHINLNVWSSNFTYFSVKLVDLGPNGVFGGNDEVEHEITFDVPATGQWITYQIPISQFTGLVTKEHIGQLIMASSNTTVYIDNVYFSTENAGCWQKISAGYDHSLGIKTDGTLWAWGGNTFAQLGDGTTIIRNAPKQIGTSTNWQKVAGGAQFSVGIKTDGTLWAWGRNESGQLGNGTYNTSFAPTQIGTASDWISVDAGGSFALAIKANGTLWAWGNNEYGRLGDGTTINKTVPTQIGTATNWQSVAAGYATSLAIKTNGTLWAWGYNFYGQVGDGTTINRLVPTQIGTATNWQSVAAGIYHSLAIKTNSVLYSWGRNSDGQLGDGTNTNKNTPTATIQGVQSVDAGWDCTVGTTTFGNMLFCGDNSFGQFGNGTNTNSNLITLSNSINHQFVSAGSVFHTLSLNTDGSLSACGNNEDGLLGDGTYVDKNVLTSITCPTSLGINDFTTTTIDVKTYPNPVKDILTLSFEQEISTVSIFNLIGQEVISKSLNSNEGTIDASNLASGTYLVKVTSNGEVKTTKIIKE